MTVKVISGNPLRTARARKNFTSQGETVKTDDYRVQAVEDARKKMAQNPTLPANIFELANALSGLETDAGENDAISLLESTYKTTSDFSFKQRAGQIKIKQLKRKIRAGEINSPGKSRLMNRLKKYWNSFRQFK